MTNFRQLRVWHAAQQLAIHVYRASSRIRGAPARTLSDQILRAALSVPTNIVEGNAHSSPKERARYLGYALASVWEVDAHLQLLSDLELISKQEVDALQEEIVAVRMMLYGLLKKVRTWKPRKTSPDRI